MLPFAVHPSARAEFTQRWSRARVLLFSGFLLPTAVCVALAVAGPHRIGAGFVLLLPGLIPVAFLLTRTYVRRSGWWAALAGFCGAFQALGIGLLWLDFRGPAIALVATAAGVVLVVLARRALFSSPQLVATELELRSTSRRERVFGRLHFAYASFDSSELRWEMSPGRQMPDTSGGKLPLRDITGVWVAEAVGAPGGQVVAVQTPYRQAQLVVGNPAEFASQLDARLRLLPHLMP